MRILPRVSPEIRIALKRTLLELPKPLQQNKYVKKLLKALSIITKPIMQKTPVIFQNIGQMGVEIYMNLSRLKNKNIILHL